MGSVGRKLYYNHFSNQLTALLAAASNQMSYFALADFWLALGGGYYFLAEAIVDTEVPIIGFLGLFYLVPRRCVCIHCAFRVLPRLVYRFTFFRPSWLARVAKMRKKKEQLQANVQVSRKEKRRKRAVSFLKRCPI